MKQAAEPLYLLLDSKYNPIARGLLLSPPDAESWQVRVLDDKLPAVERHSTLQLVSMGQGKDLLGRLVRTRGDCVVLEPMRLLSEEVRQNLRMPTDFSSFIYPLTGGWKGRRRVKARDLSCGGITFYCRQELADREQLEVVIPITEQPLILRGEVLRRRPGDGGGDTLYALQFVDLCSDEETLVRRAVFHIQLRGRGSAEQ
jgi:hypothetical protein